MYFIAKFIKTIIKVLNIYMAIQIKINFIIQIPANPIYFKQIKKNQYMTDLMAFTTGRFQNELICSCSYRE